MVKIVGHMYDPKSRNAKTFAVHEGLIITRSRFIKDALNAVCAPKASNNSNDVQIEKPSSVDCKSDSSDNDSTWDDCKTNSEGS